MTCRCGEIERKQLVHPFRRTVAGTTFTATAMVDACASCSEPRVPVASTVAFERAVAVDLARFGPISGETFRWIRKAAGLERMEVAQILGLAPETIAGWEEERRSIEIASWTLVATLVLDAIEGPRALRARLRARRRFAARPPLVHLAIDDLPPRTLTGVLGALVRPSATADGDLADELDIDPAALRGRLCALEELGLVRRSPMNMHSPDEAAWEATSADLEELISRARGGGLDVDAPLPRLRSVAELAAPRARVVPVPFRAAGLR
jgi:transcriptional regulator with XRE-family HTH domain